MSTHAIPQSPPHLKRNHRNSVLRELRAMEIVAFGHVENPETKPSDVAQLMRAYVAAEQQRNVNKMRPAPRPVEVPVPGSRRKRTASTGPSYDDPSQQQPS